MPGGLKQGPLLPHPGADLREPARPGAEPATTASRTGPSPGSSSRHCAYSGRGRAGLYRCAPIPGNGGCGPA